MRSACTFGLRAVPATKVEVLFTLRGGDSRSAYRRVVDVRAAWFLRSSQSSHRAPPGLVRYRTAQMYHGAPAGRALLHHRPEGRRTAPQSSRQTKRRLRLNAGSIHMQRRLADDTAHVAARSDLIGRSGLSPFPEVVEDVLTKTDEVAFRRSDEQYQRIVG